MAAVDHLSLLCRGLRYQNKSKMRRSETSHRLLQASWSNLMSYAGMLITQKGSSVILLLLLLLFCICLLLSRDSEENFVW